MGVYCNFCNVTFPDGPTYEKMCPHRVAHQIITGVTSAKREAVCDCHGFVVERCPNAPPVANATILGYANEQIRRTEEMLRGSTGIKHDTSKPRWSLLPAGTISQVIAVLEYGAVKYSIDNWQQVPDHKRRYYDAAMRHINAWFDEKNDPESGLPHLAHAACCLLFLMWFDNEEGK